MSKRYHCMVRQRDLTPQEVRLHSCMKKHKFKGKLRRCRKLVILDA